MVVAPLKRRDRSGRQHDEPSEWVDRWGRAGLAGRGVVYLLIAWLTIDVANGHSGHPVNERGALQAVAAHPLGFVVVIATAAALAGLAVWQGSIAARRDPEPPRRAAAAVKAGIYAVLTVSALSAVVRRHAQHNKHDWTSQLMKHLWGRVGIIAAGVVVLVVAAVLVGKAIRRRFDIDVDFHDRPALVWVGVVAMFARAANFGLVGSFLIDAAVTFDPGKARGLDGALHALAHEPRGPLLLYGVAGGLAMFGLFSLIEVRYART